MLTYHQAMLRIFQRTDFERREQPPYAERIWRLSRMEELLEQLGNPQKEYRSVHIAGTKGKGSTTAMIESILRAAGYRTGMYTSPHLHTFRERIRIAGELIPEEAVAKGVERLEPILAARPEVTVFEIITALAMCYMADERIDIGVFEVGMGGRLDATNVLHPLVSVITSVSMDHMNVLGNTLAAIAGEKAGIIKTAIPVVSAPQQPEALEVIQRVAAKKGAPLTLVGKDWRWKLLGSTMEGQRLAVFGPGDRRAPRYRELVLPLLGDHQLENACTALAAIEALREQGVAIGDRAVQQGLASVSWPGRMEILNHRPLLVVDGAHNGYSIARMLESARTYLRFRRMLVVFGVGVTHSPQELLSLLLEACDGLIVTQAHHAKATPAKDLQGMAQGLGHAAVLSESVEKGLALALEQAEEDDLVLVTGSLFVVAEAREAWAKRQGLPPYPSDPPGVYDVLPPPTLQPDQVR